MPLVAFALCAASAPQSAKADIDPIYCPHTSVNVDVPDAQSEQVFDEFIKLVKKKSSLDLNDYKTQNDLLAIASDPSISRTAPLQYTDASQIKTTVAMVRSENSPNHANWVYAIIGYKNCHFPEEAIMQKVTETEADMKEACKITDARCTVIRRNILQDTQ